MNHLCEGYQILKSNSFELDDYLIESIKLEDAEPIRRWRNSQISALRQKQEISSDQQSEYFNQVVRGEFPNPSPPQILVRFLHHNELIGYGGVVHIDWENLRGEVSFLLETTRTLEPARYEEELKIFFELICRMAFRFLGFNKLCTEAYAHRPHHIVAIENAGFTREGVLREHVKIDGQWVDAIVASCLKNEYLQS